MCVIRLLRGIKRYLPFHLVSVTCWGCKEAPGNPACYNNLYPLLRKFSTYHEINHVNTEGKIKRGHGGGDVGEKDSIPARSFLKLVMEQVMAAGHYHALLCAGKLSTQMHVPRRSLQTLLTSPVETPCVTGLGS